MKKLLILAMVLSVLLIAVPVRAGPGTLYVDDDGVECPSPDYTTIQAAVDAAYVGDTILVCDGSYAGFKADKNGVTVEAASKPVISGSGISWGGQVVGVLVTADDVTIKGLTITGQYSTGIWVESGADDVQILENTVDQTGFDPGGLTGVTWDGSAIQSHGDDTLISNNRVKFGASSKAHNGINVFWNNYTIQKNTVTIFQCLKYQVGINVRGTATVEKNIVISPDKTVGTWTRVFGIWFSCFDAWGGGTGTVQGNQVHKTDYAVWMHGSGNLSCITPNNTVIQGNTLVNNGFGVIREDDADPTIQNNRVKNSWWADYYP